MTTTNILNILLDQFGGTVTNKIASAIGEDSFHTQAAINRALPALVGGLADKASTHEGASELLTQLQRNDFDSDRIPNVENVVAKPEGIMSVISTGKSLLEPILGKRVSSMIDWVSSQSGVTKTSASSILSLALPTVLGVVGNQVSRSGWSVSSLMNLLSGQKGFLDSALSSFGGFMGFGGRTEREPSESEIVSSQVTRPRIYESTPVRKGTSMWSWLIPLLALLALTSILFSRRHREEAARVAQPRVTQPRVAQPRVAQPRVAQPRVEQPQAEQSRVEQSRVEQSRVEQTKPAANLGELTDKRLPNGIMLKVAENGDENHLISFLEDNSSAAGQTKSFRFHRLEFETNSPQIKPSSQVELRKVAEILKAYPDANVKIAGYTDNAGNASRNLQLSQNRANNTMNKLAKLGVNRQHMTAEGYGEQNPIADNSTTEGRQINRRIEFQVTK
jgi:outer membrane protein OmpA-like peptidoglycan-associated protein